ncbi:hypothetical protein BTVI_14844 [Pitangus sulphuratus]|nr:hypothetical protein BTVI_14844 [Pitangus sulphuratus]
MEKSDSFPCGYGCGLKFQKIRKNDFEDNKNKTMSVQGFLLYGYTKEKKRFYAFFWETCGPVSQHNQVFDVQPGYPDSRLGKGTHGQAAASLFREVTGHLRASGWLLGPCQRLVARGWFWIMFPIHYLIFRKTGFYWTPFALACELPQQ